MTATYTFDIFSTLDGYGSYTANASWGGYWGSKGPSSSTAALHQRSDRGGTDLPGCGRLRPGAGREPDARRPHPRAHLPTHTPLTCTNSKSIPRLLHDRAVCAGESEVREGVPKWT
jgi:hypothetical protein